MEDNTLIYEAKEKIALLGNLFASNSKAIQLMTKVNYSQQSRVATY